MIMLSSSLQNGISLIIANGRIESFNFKIYLLFFLSVENYNWMYILGCINETQHSFGSFSILRC